MPWALNELRLKNDFASGGNTMTWADVVVAIAHW
jgi:hypothetical protein